jgi:hypothetical protein
MSAQLVGTPSPVLFVNKITMRAVILEVFSSFLPLVCFFTSFDLIRQKVEFFCDLYAVVFDDVTGGSIMKGKVT